MRYYMECDCGNTEMHERSIKIGPPRSLVCKECGDKMWQDLTGGTFILKGDWPGKSIKKENSGDNGRTREINDKKIDDLKKHQQAVDETMEARRQGRKKSEEFKKNNRSTWDTAEKAMKSGVKPSKKIDISKIKKEAIHNIKKKLKSEE